MQPNKTGEYLINDVSLVKILHLVNNAYNDVSHFLDELNKSDPHTPHIFWIEDFIEILGKIKKIVEMLRLKVSAYNPSDIAPIIDTIIATESNEFRNELDHLDIAALQTHPKIAFGAEIYLDKKFAGFSANYSKILNENKSHFMLVRNNWEKIQPFVTRLLKSVKEFGAKIKENISALKECIQQNKDVTETIWTELQLIEHLLLENHADPEQQLTDVTEQVVKINSISGHFFNLHEINERKANIQNAMKIFHYKMELFPIILQSILTANPTMLYDKDEIMEILTILNENVQFISIKNMRLNQNWLASLKLFLEGSQKFVLHINVEICMLNKGDIENFTSLINSNSEYSYLNVLAPTLHKFEEFLKKRIINPNHGLLDKFNFYYIHDICHKYRRIINNLKPDEDAKLAEIVHHGTDTMAKLIEPTQGAAKNTILIYENLMKNSYKLREMIILITHLMGIHEGNTPKKRIKNLVKKFEKILNEAADELEVGLYIARAVAEGVSQMLKEANQCHESVQNELKQYFETISQV